MQKKLNIGLLIVIAILLLVPFIAPNSFYLDLAIRMAINAMIVLGLNLLIGFAGQRVIQDTIREKLPEGFQRAEYLHEHGMVDMVVHRRDLKTQLALLLDYLGSSKAA